MELPSIDHWAHQWLTEIGTPEALAEYATFLIDLLVLSVVAILVDWLARRFILRIVSRYVRKSPNAYDDVFLDKRVFQSLAHLLPILIFYYGIPIALERTGISFSFLEDVLIIAIIVLIVRVFVKFLRALEYIGLHSDFFKGKPISSYIQVGSIAIYIGAGIFIISVLVGKSALAILTTFGAATAVILLVFRDTILGFVASIQIAAQDMVRVGDWVSMEKYGADGDVLSINLTTVKIRNWDKTITTVPTYAFISDSFKNWRGMQSQGLRRIMRSIHLDLNSVDFIHPEDFNRYQRYERIRSFLVKRQEEIDSSNRDHGVDKSALINGRHLTNLGVLRHYIHAYLQEHPRISSQDIIMVRQLEPTDRGVPLQIYCFSEEIAWVRYEEIQSDLMDHILAAVEYFDLRLFQNPSGRDFQEASKNLRSRS